MEYQIIKYHFFKIYDQKQQRPVKIHYPGKIHEIINLYQPHLHRILDNIRNILSKKPINTTKIFGMNIYFMQLKILSIGRVRT